MVIKISAKIFRSKKLFSQIESLYKNIFVLRNYLSKKTILLSRKTLKKELGQKKLAGWIVWSVWLFSQWKILGQSKILEFFFYFFLGGGQQKFLVIKIFGQWKFWWAMNLVNKNISIIFFLLSYEKADTKF